MLYIENSLDGKKFLIKAEGITIGCDGCSILTPELQLLSPSLQEYLPYSSGSQSKMIFSPQINFNNQSQINNHNNILGQFAVALGVIRYRIKLIK